MNIQGNWFDPSRSGEGAFVLQKKGKFTLAVYTFSKHDPNDGDVGVYVHENEYLEITGYPMQRWLVSDVYSLPQINEGFDIDLYQPKAGVEFVRTGKPGPEGVAVSGDPIPGVFTVEEGDSDLKLTLAFNGRIMDLSYRLF